MSGYMITRDTIRKIKKMNTDQIKMFLSDFYNNAYKDGINKGVTISREVDEKSMLIKACNNTKGIGDKLTMDLVKEYSKLMEVSNGKDKD